MKNFILYIAFFCALGNSALAQDFSAVDSIKISGRATIESFWLDINNDTQHEIIVQTLTDNDHSILQVINLGIHESSMLLNDTLSLTPIQIEDVDNNNKLDIIAFNKIDNATHLLRVYSQIGDEFIVNYESKVNDFHSFNIEDWNADGYKDILISTYSGDSIELALIKNSIGGFNTTSENLLSYHSSQSLNFHDINRNGKKDLIISSFNSGNPSRPEFYFNTDSIIRLESNLPQANYLGISSGDYNHDGKLDFFSSLSTSSSDIVNQVFLNDSLSFTEGPIFKLNKFSVSLSFMADFNSDGLTDIFLANQDSSFIFQQEDSIHHSIRSVKDSSLSINFNFSDYDYDGDLDILQVSQFSFDSIRVYYIENQTPDKNYGPSLPNLHFAIQTTNGMVLIWNESIDDHSQPKNITYDVFIGSDTYSTEFLAPNFDAGTARRLKTMRGNTFFNNELLIKAIEAGVYGYGIQAIDNSLSILPSARGEGGESSPCEGRNIACGEFEYCDEIKYQTIDACFNEVLKIGDSSVIRAWYSNNNGYLGITDTMAYEVIANDTLFTTELGVMDCNNNTAFIIKLIDHNPIKLEEMIVCEPGEILLETDILFDSVFWNSKNTGLIGDSTVQIFNVIENDQIKLGGYLRGCFVEDSFKVSIENSKVLIKNGAVEIPKGGSVNLIAEGAITYEWSPSESLNQSNIANPIATPLVTTQYIVKGVSANNCISYDSITVTVKSEAFIPELFTPNGDGKNDRLLIYGLQNVTSFEFTVYDREGNIIFQTTDAETMATKGWDGYLNQSKIKAGLFFWQVRGKYKDGQQLLLNGQKKGKVLLSK